MSYGLDAGLKHHADTVLSNASAQNVWNTLLDYYGPARACFLAISVAVANETLEVELTLDGQVYDGTQAAVAGTVYAVYASSGSVAAGALTFLAASDLCIMARAQAECSSHLKIRFRKTTATGLNAITCRLVWAANQCLDVGMTHQADLIVAQAAPVQNTWYTLLATRSKVRAYFVNISVAATGETLEVEITADGQVYSGSQAAVAGSVYPIRISPTSVAVGYLAFYTAADTKTGVMGITSFLEAQSLQIRFRKTTAAGVGTITAKLVYARS